MRRRALTIALLAMFWTVAAAQAQTPTPPRDAAAAPAKGTAAIVGRVVSVDRQEPLHRATITISGGGLAQPRITSTNSKGEYQARDLPAGRYTMRVTRSGYLPLQNGQRFPDEPGRPVELADGAEVEVHFALPRGSVISGRITDETGDVVPSVNVWALQPRFFRRERKHVPVRSTRADDTGNYRITGLPPGEYVIMTTLRETWTVMRDDEKHIFGYATSYYPSTANLAEAQRVQVGVGQEVSAIDFALVPGRAATVSGTAIDIDGRPLEGVSVSIGQTVEGPSGSMGWTVGTARTAPDGTWTIRDVPPGEFSVGVFEPGRPTRSASVPLSVAGSDVTGIVLRPDVPVAVSGTVVTDTGEPLPSSSRLRVVPESVMPGRNPLFALTGDESGVVAADGSFTIPGAPPGPTLWRLMPVPPAWAIRSVAIAGRDHAAVPIALTPGHVVSGVRIVLSRTLPVITGRTVDADGQSVAATVLLFPVNESRWHEAGGSLHHARPDQRGEFRIEHVRPGDYHAIAMDYVPDWQVTDPEFLDRVRKQAIRIKVADGENEPLVLQVVR
jgi:hypothetical protein